MIEIEYEIPQGLTGLGEWQVKMSKQIENNRGVPITDIEKELNGNRLIVRINSKLSSTAIRNTVSDIKSYCPPNSIHVETREV